MTWRIATVLLAALLASAGDDLAHAQALGFSNSGDLPIAIEADNGIEWQRTNQLYIARGNAKAAQGTGTVEADMLTAYYRATASGDTEIYRIDADGNVRITTENEVATAEKAVYDVTNGVLVLTGEGIRLDTQQDRIVANDSLEYYADRRLAVARGDAVAVRENRRVRADVLMGHFPAATSAADAGTATGGLERIEAVGNVVITTDGDIARADEGDYDVNAGFATLRGRVKITRGDDQINGEFAEIDLNTGVSRLVGDPSATTAGEPGRVKALIMPASRGPSSPDEATR